MVLCDDIARVVMVYLGPKQIVNFFKECGLDFGMKFMYDARCEMMKCDEINYVLGKFSNIVVTGVFYDASVEIMCSFVVNMIKVSHLAVECGGTNDADKMIIRKLLMLMPNVTKLDIIDCSMRALKGVNVCVKLEHLTVKIKNNDISPYLEGISKCESLCTLTLERVQLNCDDFNEISRCNRLVRLEMYGGSCIPKNIRCKSLRVLRFKNCYKSCWEDVCGCDRVERISINGWYNLMNIEGMKGYSGLKKLRIKHCPGLEKGEQNRWGLKGVMIRVKN